MNKQNIEVEGQELLLRSDEGHYAITPAKDRERVLEMLKKGCNDCINAYIQKLPKHSDYAEDGSLIDAGVPSDGIPPKGNKAVDLGTQNAPYTFVDSADDERYKAYSDSLKLYNLSNNQIESSVNNGAIKIREYPVDDVLISKEFTDINKDIKPSKAYLYTNANPDRDKNIDFYSNFVKPVYSKPTEPVFVKGTKKYDNAKKQVELQKAGLYKGKIDGIWGDKSEKAWSDYNKSNINNTVEKPKELNFIKRMNDPNQKSIDNGDGTYSTHKMMSFEVDGKQLAAPTIVEKDGKLVELKPKEAIDYALKTGEYKEFKTEEEAQKYAEGGYKMGTPMEKDYLLDKKNKEKPVSYVKNAEVYINNTTPILANGNKRIAIKKDNPAYIKLQKKWGRRISAHLTQEDIDEILNNQ